MRGCAGCGGWLKVAPGSNGLERGALDAFPLQLHCSGRLTKLQVKLAPVAEGLKPNWHFDYVKVTLTNPAFSGSAAPQIVYFNGPARLSPADPFVELPASTRKGFGTYSVQFWTGAHALDGADGSVSVVLHGSATSGTPIEV